MILKPSQYKQILSSVMRAKISVDVFITRRTVTVLLFGMVQLTFLLKNVRIFTYLCVCLVSVVEILMQH